MVSPGLKTYHHIYVRRDDSGGELAGDVTSATANGNVSRLMKRHRRLVFFPFTIVVTAAAGTGHVRTAVNIFSQLWMP